MEKIRILESPRDGIQGLPSYIPVKEKVKYYNDLLKVGFEILDFGSFVSPKAIPQMKDTGEVAQRLDLSDTQTQLLVIIGNTRGAKEAANYNQIKYLGFPFSTSETFLRKNINSTREKSRIIIDDILNICEQHNKTLNVYISMAFGNPYGDPWNEEIVLECVRKMAGMGVENISFSDITGVASPESVAKTFQYAISEFGHMNFGLHLHTMPHNYYEKIDAAWKSGCRWFDGVLNGRGGCPMTGYEMLGNLDTNNLISYFNKNNIEINIDREMYEKCRTRASFFYALGEKSSY